MEMVLAILMVLGIFIGVPFIVGLAIGGAYMVHERRVFKTEKANSVEKAEEIVKAPAKEKTQVKVV